MLNVIHVADTLISELDAIARALPPGAAGTSRGGQGRAVVAGRGMRLISC